MNDYDMTKRFVFILIFAFTAGFATSRANTVLVVDDPAKDVVLLAEQFCQLLVLSDYLGNYEPAQVADFLNLFDKEAVIYNFMEGTETYQQSIAPAAYTQLVGKLSETYIIQVDGPFDIQTGITITQGWEDKLIMTAMIKGKLVLVARDFSSDHSISVDLQLTISKDKQRNIMTIQRVSQFVPDVTDLVFQVVLGDREAAAGIPVIFYYYDPVQQRQIRRTRYTNDEGEVTLSYVPYTVNLGLELPEDIVRAFSDERPVAEWAHMNTSRRLVVSKPADRLLSASSRNLVQFGLSHALNLGSGPLESYDTLNVKNFKTLGFDNLSIQPVRQSGIYINYAYRVLQRKKFSLSVGVGFEYQSSELVSSGSGQLHQQFIGLKDIDDDEFTLDIVAEKVSETYSFRAFRLPVLATMSIKTGIDRIESIDLTTSLAYGLRESLTFYSSVMQTTEGEYPVFALRMVDPVYEPGGLERETNRFSGYYAKYGYVRNKQFEDEKGDLPQKNRLSASMQLSVRLALKPGKLWIQPALNYSIWQTGRREALADWNNRNRKDDGTLEEPFFYLPSLGYHELTIHSLNIGIGLLYAF